MGFVTFPKGTCEGGLLEIDIWSGHDQTPVTFVYFDVHKLRGAEVSIVAGPFHQIQTVLRA